MGLLTQYFNKNNMASMNDVQLENRITRVSCNRMYDYKADRKVSDSYFKENFIRLWNSLPFEMKMLPYTNISSAMNNFKKGLSSK